MKGYKETQEVEIYGITLVVEGFYSPQGLSFEYDTEPDAEEFELYGVFCNGQDIQELLSQDMLREVQEKVIGRLN